VSEEKKEGRATPTLEEAFEIIQAHHHALNGISQHLMEVAGRVGEVEAVLQLMLGTGEEGEGGEGPSPQADGH
jgi:hypothetical protein